MVLNVTFNNISPTYRKSLTLYQVQLAMSGIRASGIRTTVAIGTKS